MLTHRHYEHISLHKLLSLLCCSNISAPSTEGDAEETDTDHLRAVYEGIIKKEVNVDGVLQDHYVTDLLQATDNLCSHISQMSRTAKLWIQYYQQVSLMHLHIHAERTGDWDLHLYCVKEILPHFHAAGHLAHAKSAHLYLQQMSELPERTPENEPKQLTDKGYFTVDKTRLGPENFLTRQ